MRLAGQERLSRASPQPVPADELRELPPRKAQDANVTLKNVVYYVVNLYSGYACLDPVLGGSPAQPVSPDPAQTWSRREIVGSRRP